MECGSSTGVRQPSLGLQDKILGTSPGSTGLMGSLGFGDLFETQCMARQCRQVLMGQLSSPLHTSRHAGIIVTLGTTN